MRETSGSPDILQTVIDLLPEDGTSSAKDLARWGVSLGSGMAVASLSEALLQHIKAGHDGSEEEVTTARNSAAREISAGPIGKLAGVVHETLPKVTPSHITKAGETMVEAASAMIVARPDHPVIATAIYTGGSLLDTFDGSLARQKGMDCPEGMIEDVEADLKQQIVTFGALSVVAMRRGNRVAAANYAMAAMLTPLSAYTRAQAESRGLIVGEGGLGTRLGRGIMGGVGMALNKYGAASDAVSATLAVGTANTVAERRDVVKNGIGSEYCVGTNDDPAFIKEAELRLKAIRPFAEEGLRIGSALLAADLSDSVQAFIPKVA